MSPLEKYLRPEVQAFARAMEKKLRENDYKGGWKGYSARDLLACVVEEVAELAALVVNDGEMLVMFYDLKQQIYRAPLRRRVSKSKASHEAADVANMAMMVADVLGALLPPAPAKEGGG